MSKNDIRELYNKTEKLARYAQKLKKDMSEEASEDKAGVVKLDGESIIKNEDGTISAVVDAGKVVGIDEINIEDSKAVSSKAVMDFTIQKINNIEDLRKTIGKFEGQVVELLGYYHQGQYSLKYIWSNSTSLDADREVIINVDDGSWSAQIENNIVDVAYFGAKTDNTDNLIHINKAITYCNKIASSTNVIDLVFNKDSYGQQNYKCSDKLNTIEYYINFIQHDVGIQFMSVIDDVYISVGSPNKRVQQGRRRHKFRISLFNYTQINRVADFENCVGVRLVNDSTSETSFEYIAGFHIGAQLYANYECAYNKYYLTKFANNIIDIDLCQVKEADQTGVGGWINENIFFGGSFSLHSSANIKQYKKHCVRVRSSNGYTNNSNLMIKPSFEAHPTGVLEDAYVINLENATGFKVINARLESSPVYFSFEGVNSANYYSFDYVHQPTTDDRVVKINAPNGTRSIIENLTEKGLIIYKSANLLSDFKNSGTRSGFINYKLASVNSENTTRYNDVSNTSGPPTIKSNSVSTGSYGLSQFVKVTKGDSFSVYINNAIGYNLSRIYLKAYDKEGVVLTEGVGTTLYKLDSTSPVGNFGNCWGPQENLRRIRFTVTNDNVDKVEVIFRGDSIIDFQIYSNYTNSESYAIKELPLPIKFKNSVTTSDDVTFDDSQNLYVEQLVVNNLQKNITINLRNSTINPYRNLNIHLRSLNGYSVTVNTLSNTKVFSSNDSIIEYRNRANYWEFVSLLISGITKSTAVANVTATAPTAIPPQTMTTIEDAQATINILVSAINDLKVLSEANKTQLNSKLAADRASGQQAT